MASRTNIVVIGCGRLGASLASHASGEGRNVIVVDSDPEAFDRLYEGFSGFTVEGDATDQSVLANDARIETAYKVLVTTGNDNVNLFLARLCSVIYEVPEVLVRFDDPQAGELIKDLKNVRAVYPFELSYQKLLSLEGEDF